MNIKLHDCIRYFRIDVFRFCLSVVVVLLANNVSAFTTCTDGDHGLSLGSCDNSDCSFATTVGSAVNEVIEVSGAAGDVEWEFTANCPGDVTNDNTTTCRGITATAPVSPANPAEDVTLVSASATAGADEAFTLSVADGTNICSRNYIMRVTASGGGWGDPHMTTVDGVKYDFQSAGEFTLLRGDNMEVQTRQTAVSKQNVAGTNSYTGLASCVSIYTAAALKVGPHRVTIQPNLNGEPDPSGLQLRVNGELKTLGPEGIDLSTCNCPSEDIENHGRIQRGADEESIEVLYADGARVVVTPSWWNNQQRWYLNVNVYDTSASEGLIGPIAEGSWLPALEDGSNVGPKAADMHDRYVQLYETFADSWRVTGTSSLFDYAPGTSTADFTLEEWPRENPENCLLEGAPTVVPVTQAEAEEACKNVVDPDNRENCIFDVRETGHHGFADAYERSELLVPGATRTVVVADKSPSDPGQNVTFTATVQRQVSTIGKITSGRIQFFLNGDKVGEAKTFDAEGNVSWSTADLTLGTHEVKAQYLPSAFGERFVTSSGKLSHQVGRKPRPDGGEGNDDKQEITGQWWFWLIILILILLLQWLWRRLNTKN